MKQRRTIYLIIEMVLIFIGLPLLKITGLFPYHELFLLLTGSIVILIILNKDPNFDNSIFFRWKNLKPKPKLFRLMVLSLLAIGLIFFLNPDLLFYYIKSRPEYFFLILALYPFVSVVPQELVYRAFFFHRYSFISNKYLLILINSILFSFAHLTYDNAIAPLATLLINPIFCYTYLKRKSFPEVCFEHLLYGAMIYIIGLGYYFIVRN